MARREAGQQQTGRDSPDLFHLEWGGERAYAAGQIITYDDANGVFAGSETQYYNLLWLAGDLFS